MNINISYNGSQYVLVAIDATIDPLVSLRDEDVVYEESNDL